VKQEIVIFDIDGTLADVSERIHHLQKNPRIGRPLLVGWHKTKRSNRCAFVTFLFLGSLGSLCSGRSEEHRSETIAWLKKERVKYHELRLRKSGDRRSDVIVKREMLHRIDETKVLFVVEDRNRVVEMWRKEGLVCLQCAPGEF
jgi:FMN phosphatase YigB (HAD superfamily)